MKLKRVFWWTVLAIPVLIIAIGLVAYASSTNECDAKVAPTISHPMKAITYCSYGDASVVKLTDVEKPSIGDSDLLIRVRAASVNPLDWHFVRGTPYLMRLMSGLRKPSEIRLGVDFAGTIEAVGKSVTRFKPGDDVFGGKTGAFAEYVTVRESHALALKPAGVTFEQAASVPIAALTALQSVRDEGKVQAGQTVLINGASGGVGTFTVQVAKSYGAIVTGVCSGKNVELVKSLGADQVVDYAKDDYTKGATKYDVVIDNVGNRSLLENRRILKPKVRYVLVGGGGLNDGKWVGPMANFVKPRLLSPFVSQHMGMFVANLTEADLKALADLIQSGKVTPVIDRRYKLSEVPAAITYLEGGHARGKVVIVME